MGKIFENGFIFAFIFVIFASSVLADEYSNYFSVKDIVEEYGALPGDTVTVQFTMSNRDWVYPKNVTAYIEPCFEGWVCEHKTFSYNSRGIYPENLTMKIPTSALLKRYTTYVLLSSDADARRGNDRIVIDVISPEQSKVVSYDQYSNTAGSIVKNPALATVSPPVKSVPVKDPAPSDVLPKVLPQINGSEVVESVERMESSKQFMEYISVVLIIALVLVAVGAYFAFMKYRKKVK